MPIDRPSGDCAGAASSSSILGGILSDAPFEEVVELSDACLAAVRELGCEFPAPFQTLSFLALSVIPKLKITDQGLIDVEAFEIVGLEA